jgi:hypothetical protein
MKKHIYILFFLTLGVINTSLFSQDIITKEYRSGNGLPSDIVYEVFQDSDKFLWFSTEFGVSRFNGKQFSNYGFNEKLPDNVIFETKETEGYRKWFLSGNGKVSYLTNEGVIEKDTLLNLKAFISELIQIKKEGIAIASFGDGIKIKEKDNVIHLNQEKGLIDNYVSFIWEQGEAIYTISTLGISKINANKSIDTIFKFDKPIHFSRACELTLDGGVLFSARDKVYILSKNDKLKELNNSSDITKNTLNKISYLNNDIYVAATNRGATFFKIRNDSIIVTKTILENYPVTSIILDHEHNYWVSTLGKGVIRFNENIFKQEGVSQKAFCFFRDLDRSIYIGYENHLYAKKKGNQIEYFELDKKNNYSNQKIKSIQREKDNLWFLMDGGLASFDGEKTNFYRGLSGDFLLTDNQILIGGGVGYFKASISFLLDSLIIDANNPEDPTLKNKQQLDVKTNSIKKFRNVFLIGTKNGLYIDNGLKIDLVNHEILSKAKIENIFIKNDNIVISTYGFGVFLINKNDTIQFAEQNGLVSDFCQTSYIDNETLYIGTNRGLNIIEDYLSENHIVYSITTQDGLKNNDIQDIIVDGDKVMLATLAGVFSFNKKNISKIDYEIPLRIEYFSINDSPIHYLTKNKFSYMENRLSFKISPVSFKYADRIKTYFKLGESINWKEFNGNYLEFNSLMPGNYDLQVKAIINKRSSKIFSYAFVVKPPFWRTWWFISIACLIVILLIYWFFKIRVLTYNRDVVRELIVYFINKLKKEEYVLMKDVKDGSYVKVVLNNLVYIKGSGNYVELHFSTSNKMLSRATLKEVHELLNKNKKQKFIRCHKSYIINQRSVTAVHGDFIKLKEEKIPIGKQYLSNITEIENLLK